MYPYPFLSKKGNVICQICGKDFLVISPRHLTKHNIKYEEYQKRFPEAPLATKEFCNRASLGKSKELFKEVPDAAEECIEEPAKIEELDIEEILKNEIKTDPIKSMKNRILDQLKMHFSNVQKDYFITQYGSQYSMQFEFISDFCDPILKLVIQFPDVFWHNSESYPDPNKNYKLEMNGWKVIEIKSQNPSFEDIENAIKLI